MEFDFSEFKSNFDSELPTRDLTQPRNSRTTTDYTERLQTFGESRRFEQKGKTYTKVPTAKLTIPDNFNEYSKSQFELESHYQGSKAMSRTPSKSKDTNYRPKYISPGEGGRYIDRSDPYYTKPNIPIKKGSQFPDTFIPMEEPNFRREPKFNIPPPHKSNKSKSNSYNPYLHSKSSKESIRPDYENKENRSVSKSSSHQIPIPEDIMYVDEDFLPNDVYYLLAHEENNLATFRERIEKDKAKLESDFSSFSKDLLNQLEEMKIRLYAGIDVHYQELITKYKAFKSDVMEFKSIKMEMPHGNIKGSKNIEYAEASNSHLLRELDEIKHNQQMNKIFQYINLQTKEILGRVLTSSKEVMQILTGICVFYHQDNTQEALREIRNGFIGIMSKIFNDQKAFVKSKMIPNYFSTASRFSKEPGMSVYPMATEEEGFDGGLSEKFERSLQEEQFSEDSGYQGKYNGNTRGTMKNHSGSVGKKYSKPIQAIQSQSSTPLNTEYLKQPMPAVSFPLENTIDKISGFHKPYKLKPDSPRDITSARVAPVTKSFTNGLRIFVPNLGLSSRFQALENISGSPNLPDSILCACVVNSDLVVFGLRNGHIACFDLKSKTCSTLLKGHTGGICSMLSWTYEGTEMVASGSDHGDCSIILWKIKDGVAFKKLEGHSAAVVSMAIIDNGRIIASASYDKEIFLWDTIGGGLIQKVIGHQSSITCLTTSLDSNQMYSASLDGKIICWKIEKGKEMVKYETSFSNEKLICAMAVAPFKSHEVVVGTKEGKVRLIDFKNGGVKGEIVICDSPIIELMCMEGRGFEDSVFIASSLKSSSLYLFRFNGAPPTVLNLDTNHYIEFGCGISPKLQIFKKDSSIKILSISQSQEYGGYGLWDLIIS